MSTTRFGRYTDFIPQRRLASRTFFADYAEINRRPPPFKTEKVESFIKVHPRITKALLKIAVRLMPEIRVGGDAGMIFGMRERGQHAEAIAHAVDACERLRSLDDETSAHWQFWMFLSLATEMAAELAASEPWTRVWWMARSPVPPIEGYYAANVMHLLSEWHLANGRSEDAVATARLSLGADPTWSPSSVWAARLGVRGMPFDAHRMLRDAIAIDESQRAALQRDRDFQASELQRAIRQAPLRVAPEDEPLRGA